MASETEEFEFRRRLEDEKELAASDRNSINKYVLPNPTGSGSLLGALDSVNQGIYNAGGAVTDYASSKGLSPETAAKLGYGTNIGLNFLTGGLGGFGGGSVAKPAFQPMGEWLMNSALKPTLEAHRSGDAAKAIKTMLDEGYNATKGGVKAMSDEVGNLNDFVRNAVANSNAQINKYAVYSRLAPVENKFMRQVNPQGALSSIQDVGDQFLSHPLLSGQTNMPVQLAQNLKTGTYKQLQDSYGELSNAATEAQKGLARGLKEEIGSAVPEVVGPLSKESALINALDVAERRTMMDTNKNPGGLAWFAGNPVSAAGYLADRWSLLKSLLARALYSGAPLGGAAGLGTYQGLRQGALMGSPNPYESMRGALSPETGPLIIKGR